MVSTYIIIGGVAGGASTAARLRRLDEKARIILFERGPDISYANCGLPYYTGNVIQERDRLFVMTPEKFHAWLNVEVRTETQALSVDGVTKTVTVRDRKTGREYTESWDALVLAPGAEPVRPPIPGIGDEGIFIMRSPSDADAIDAWIKGKRPERAIVVGGGFIGLEMAENLHKRGCFVTIVEALDQVMNPLDFEMASLVHAHLREIPVELYLGESVVRFERLAGRTVVHLSSGTALAADIVILSIGVKPDTDLAKTSGIALTPRGAILVDKHMQTNLPGVYALGDAAACVHPILGQAMPIPLAGPANKQARVVAGNIVSPGSRTWNGAIGTSIAKVFEISAASSGIAEKTARAAGISCISAITHGSSHASYYPGARPVTIKTVFDPVTGTLYGAQVVGFDGVDKRMDLLAETIRRQGTIYDLAHIEHSYAPPFSSAKDPVNIAGMVAEDILDGLTRHVSWKEVESIKENGAFLLDVRTPEEFVLGAIGGSTNIPLDEIRRRLGEIPRDRFVLCYCGVGLRGYLAERILRQCGYTETGNLSGGYKIWEEATARQSLGGLYEAGARNSIQSSFGGSCAEEEAHKAHVNEIFAEGTGLPESMPPVTQPAGESVSAERARIVVDACGLQCPGPIMKLKSEMDRAQEGTRIIISATDPGFTKDVESWTRLTKNLLVGVERKDGVYTATIEKTEGQAKLLAAALSHRGQGSALPASIQGNAATLIIFSDDMDKALAGFVLANGAAASGKSVTMFFTFWGLSVIKRKEKPRVRKDLMGRMFGMMLPGHNGALALSKMNFAGLGALMMKSRMKAKNVDMLESMMAQALGAGVRMVACQMSMDIMGVAAEELADGVEIGGVATYMEAASEGNVNLFI